MVCVKTWLPSRGALAHLVYVYVYDMCEHDMRRSITLRHFGSQRLLTRQTRWVTIAFISRLASTSRVWDVPVCTPAYPSVSWTGNGCMSWSAQIPPIVLGYVTKINCYLFGLMPSIFTWHMNTKKVTLTQLSRTGTTDASWWCVKIDITFGLYT